ncbi:hypothetical protein CQY20_31230 [Mycolicibacterium agri]|uniref:Uncharacterized protein n=2 Tax=Mycolicibacterium agri TaxID=36811 RepID=A0A2A7MPC1_MYCAG|nr:hypothetical protein [Mycolicibacterium agri]PEG33343.1 hypothetical protein CQY20_31230 [Mycolicibacterium agri]GFG52160.1 hypothetical protein MAGR_36010 [Mycolicibacterium agri]
MPSPLPVAVVSLPLPLPIATLLMVVLLLVFPPLALIWGLKMFYEAMLICVMLPVPVAPPSTIGPNNRDLVDCVV